MVLKAKTTRRDTDAKQKAMEQAAGEATKRLNAEVPLSLHKRVKARAVQDGSTMNAIVTQALLEYLSK